MRSNVESAIMKKPEVDFRRLNLWILLFATTVGLLLCGVASVAIAEELDDKTVRVGYYEQEVFEEGAQDGAAKQGYAYDYYRKLSEYTGWSYEYVYGEYTDLYNDLINGKIDLLAGLAYKEERTRQLLYPQLPMGNETYNLVKHDTNTGITNDPSTLNGARIGVLESALADVLNSYLQKHHVDADVQTFADNDALFRAFDDSKIDVLAAEGDGAYGRNHAEVLGAFGSSDYYLCVNRTRPDLLDELNTAQAELNVEEPDYIATLRARYYGNSVTSRAFSQSEREWLKTHNVLRIGYLDDYLPYSDTTSNGSCDGLVQLIVPQMLDALGIKDVKVEYAGFASYDKMVAAVNEGTVDAVFPIGGNRYFAEENGIYQSRPVLTTVPDLIYKGDYSEQKTARIAVNENNRIQDHFVRTDYPSATIVTCTSAEECLNAVVTGKADSTVLGMLRATQFLKDRRFKGLTALPLSHNDDRCLGVRIGNEGLLHLLNRGISMLGDDYALNQVYRYADELHTYTVLDVIVDNMPLFGSIVLGIAVLIIVLLARDSKRSKRQQDELARALMAAEAANRAKTTFLNNMSHDIRTPMNAIVGFTALAASHIDNKEQVQDYLGKISVSSQHLLSLINDVLDMSHIESGKMVIEEAEVHLPDLIHDIRTIIQSNMTAKRQELFIDTQDVVSEDIYTDRLRLSQVLLNILTNAIKFTPPEGTVSLRVIEKATPAPDRTCFEFRIKDNGIGMSEEFQRTIFDPFTRAQTSTVSGIQGTGLGMTITKNIVDMMGGTIEVHSKEGKGTEFIVRIPCRVQENPTAHEPMPELEGVRTLVADDDTNTCLSVSAMLREIGMRPVWTNYGKEAVIRAQEALDEADEFKVYIIDWMLPDLNGIETVRRIRRVVGDDTPVIILTAYDWSDIEEEAREAGVTAFCSKPLFMSELRAVLSNSYAKHEEPALPDEDVTFEGKRILLVEDNELNMQIASEILSAMGLEVDAAYDGTEAVERMEQCDPDRYDLILMDIQMPQMDGYEATKLIRALGDERKASIPIIAVTANAFSEDRGLAKDAGMNDYLAKPYDIAQIKETLAHYLA